MKKLFALILAMCMLCTVLSACGDSSASSSDDSSKDSSSAASSTVADADVVNIADYDGCWKLNNGTVGTVKIDAATSTVTAWNMNGYEIGTFKCVATAEGLVLKMGSYGLVTLNDASTLTITTEPFSAKPDLSGKWILNGNTADNVVLDLKSDGSFTISGNKTDMGTYTVSNDVASITPTKDLGGTESHKIKGGAIVLHNENNGVWYVKEDSLSSNEGKSMTNYFTLYVNEWKSTDGSYTAEFANDGTVKVGGADAGIWYPTSAGATVEYSDGSTDYITFGTDGSFTLNYYGKTFQK